MQFTQQEIDNLLPFLLKRDNVARYEEGVVYIGDRRKYPFEKVFYKCESVEEVAVAIEIMVTQGGGPSIAATFAMAMAASEVKDKNAQDALEYLDKARIRLTNTRPTNTALARRLDFIYGVCKKASAEGQPIEQAILDFVNDFRDKAYEDYIIRGRLGADLIEDGDGILTMCFAETAFIMALALAKRDGKNIQVFTPETRPYLQGARLTAPCVHEIGVPVTVITDNMPAHIMAQGKIQKYFTAADLITLDGHVVNKIGTFQNAVCAHYHHIPYFAFMWGADPKSPDFASIEIEERDPAEIRACRGVPTTIDELNAYYPAFDVTPPHLVAGIITRHGIVSPYDIERHYFPK